MRAASTRAAGIAAFSPRLCDRAVQEHLAAVGNVDAAVLQVAVRGKLIAHCFKLRFHCADMYARGYYTEDKRNRKP